MVYTRWLGSSVVVADSNWHELYRAPDAGTVVLRDIVIASYGAAAVPNFAVRLRPLTKVGEIFLLYARPLAVGTAHYDLRQVLRPNWSVEYNADGGAAAIHLTGYVFA